MKARIFVIGLWSLLLWRPSAEALTVETQVDLLLNSLRFDQGLAARMARGLKIGVLSLEGHAPAQSLAVEVERSFRELAEKKFGAESVQVIAIRGKSPEEIIAAMTSQGLDLVFICPSPEDCLKKLLDAASAGKVMVMASDSESVAAGAALAVVDRGGRPRILLNVDAAKAQGASFKPSFLRLAECLSSDGQLKPVYQHPNLVGKRKVAGADPVYPKIARLAKKEGTVVAKLTIAPEGRVTDVSFIKGDKLFEAAVREALTSWRFAPHQVAGRSMPTYTVMNFQFNLN